MDIEIHRQRIVNQFKRNGLFLNKSSLDLISDHLRGRNNPHKNLDEVIKKVNQMVIMEQQDFNENTLKVAIQLLNHRTQTGKAFNSYDKFLEHIRKWTIFYVSPYESNQRFFVDKPDPSLFKFSPEDYIEMNKARFKAIKEYNTPKIKQTELYTFIGVLYEKFAGERNKIMLQNQINEVELIFSPNFNIECFLIPGCTYIAQGDFKSKDIQLHVQKLNLPLPLPSRKQNIFYSKLKLVCDNISLSKNGLDYTREDFKKYDFIFNKSENSGNPILIFGNVKINQVQIKKIKNIIQAYPQKIQCLILMIADEGHSKVDIKKEIGEEISVYIVPHINSQGPRILPKIPIMKTDYNTKIVTNPARFSIQGKQCLLVNYPITKNLCAKSLIQKLNNVENIEIAKKVSNLIYSQSNIALTHKIFWKQSSYLDVSCEDIIFLCEKGCPEINYEDGKGRFVSVGNFQRDGDFVCFMPHFKSPVQMCNSRPE